MSFLPKSRFRKSRTQGVRDVFAPAAAAALAVLLSASPATAADCPSGEDVAAAMEKTFRKKVQVKRIQPAVVEGLCEVIVTLQGKASILYIDDSGRHFVSGQIIDSESRKDLTREAMAEYNKFTPEEVAQLEDLTALTYGTGGPPVYFVTDPD